MKISKGGKNLRTSCRIADLKYKEVINTSTGERLGYAGDVEISLSTGEITSLVVPGSLKFFGIFGRHDDVVIPWSQIDRIGDDIILVHFEKSPNS